MSFYPDPHIDPVARHKRTEERDYEKGVWSGRINSMHWCYHRWNDENFKLHRLDGPAIEYEYGAGHGDTKWTPADRDAWFWHGVRIHVDNQADFEKIIAKIDKLKAFL